MNEETIKLAQGVAIASVHLELIGKLPQEEIKEIIEKVKKDLGI